MHSRRNVAIPIVLVALVALAGCSSVSLSDSPGANSTTKSLDDLSLPAGASDEMIENGSKLAQTHSDLLSERGYSVELTASYSAEQGTRNSTYVVQRDAETGELYLRTVARSGSGAEYDFAYANETATYEKRGTEDPSYSVDTSSTSDDQVVNNIARATGVLVPAGNWTDPSVVSKDGRTFIEYDLAGISSDNEFIDAATVTNASGSLLVDQQGLVHHVTLNVTRERDGTTSEAHFEYRVTELGDVEVEKPGWVSTAVGQEETTTVSSRVVVVAGAGNVGDGRVETINLTVMRAAGAGDIDLSKATVQWIGPDTATTLTAGDTTTQDTFVVEPVRDADDSAPILNEQEDRFKITMDASEVGSALAAGDEAQLTITTQYGAKTTYWVSVPEDLSGESTVRL